MRHPRGHPQDALRDIPETLGTIHEPPHPKRPSMRPLSDLHKTSWTCSNLSSHE